MNKAIETIQGSNQKTGTSPWIFNQLDLNCLNLVIKGGWVFDYSIDEAKLKSSLSKLLDLYPQLAGRIKDK